MASNDASRMLRAGRTATRPTHVAPVPDPAPMAGPDEATSPLVDETPPKPLAYIKTSFFIRPDQRAWLNEVVARAKLDGLEGISASDVVRLALCNLQVAHGDGHVSSDLVGELIEQAHAEAERFPGRKNRGLPSRR